MLLYILQLYDRLMRNSQKGDLPAIFPILLYNGSKKWTIPENIQDLIEHSIPLKYIPSFQYYPVIENRIPDKVLKKIKGTVAAIIYLEKQKDEKKLNEAIKTVIELIKGEHPEQVRMFSVWLNRMFSNVFKSEETEKINQLRSVNLCWHR